MKHSSLSFAFPILLAFLLPTIGTAEPIDYARDIEPAVSYRPSLA